MDLEAVYHRYHATLYRYILHLSGDPHLAADLLHETFLRLLESGAPHADIRPWLFRVATNLVRERGRTDGRRIVLFGAAPADALHGDAPLDPDAVLQGAERHRAVRAALHQLSERDRTVLLMREEGFSHAEIAAAVRTTTKSVGTIIARALDKLARALPWDKEAI